MRGRRGAVGCRRRVAGSRLARPLRTASARLGGGGRLRVAHGGGGARGSAGWRPRRSPSLAAGSRAALRLGGGARECTRRGLLRGSDRGGCFARGGRSVSRGGRDRSPRDWTYP